MKRSLTHWLRLSGLLLLLLTTRPAAQAQTGVTIGASTAPDVSAALDIIGTGKGVLLPRVALATAVVTPATGLIVFQTTAPAGYYYNAGTAGAPSWQQVATAAGAAITADNGLTKTGQNIALGGTLTAPTTLSTTAANPLTLTGAGALNLGTGAGAGPVALGRSGGTVALGPLAGTGTRLVTADAAGTLGTNQAVYGTAATIPAFPAAAAGSVNTNANPYSVAVSGTTAYVANNGGNTLQVFNVANPASPALQGSVSTGGGSNPIGVAVSGTTAYVVNFTTNALQVVNVASPTSSVLQGSVSTGANTGPRGVAVSGTTAYVVNQSSSTLQIINVADPAIPVLQGSVSTGANPRGVAVSGTTAYVVNISGDNLQTFNVANPASPTLLGTVSTGSSSAPSGVAVSGTTAYVVTNSSNTLQIFNVANPASPVLLGSVGTDSGPQSVAVSGTTAYVVNFTNSTLQAFNVANPASPALLGTVSTGASSGPRSVAVSGATVCVANQSTNALRTFTFPLQPRAVAVQADGSLASVALPSSTDFVQNTTTAQAANFNVNGAGTVGGLLTAGSAAVAGATSTASLAVTGLTTGSVPFIGSSGAVSQDNATLFFDNTNKRLGIGTNVPGVRLDVNGGARLAGTNTLELGGGVTKEINAGKIGYQTFTTDALDIVGAGTTASNRKIKFFAEGGTEITGRVGIGTPSPNSTLQVAGAVSLAYTTANTDLTLTSAHYTVRRAGGCNTITLPQPGTCTGRLYVLINSNGTGSNVTLTVATSGIIYDDVTNITFTVLVPNTRIVVQSDGVNWIVVGR